MSRPYSTLGVLDLGSQLGVPQDEIHLKGIAWSDTGLLTGIDQMCYAQRHCRRDWVGSQYGRAESVRNVVLGFLGHGSEIAGPVDADNAVLDRIARATVDESRFEDWQQLYRDERPRIPDVIESYSPAVMPEEMPLVVRMPINT